MEFDYKITAYHIANKIPFKLLENIELTIGATICSRTNMTIEMQSGDSKIYLFSFGAIAFFNSSRHFHDITILRFLNEYRNVLIEANPDYAVTKDDLNITTGDVNKVYFDHTEIAGLNSDLLRILALTLSDSVVMEYYESRVDRMLERSSEYAKRAKVHGVIPRATKRLIRFIGDCMDTKQTILANLLVLDAPDEVWEDPEIDKIFYASKRMLEIESRFKVIDYKLRIVQENLSTILDMSSSRMAMWLELTIIFLILTEILMAVFKFIN